MTETEAKTTPAKYVFLDVVGFTNQRSVEAQADIVGHVNSVVKRSLDQNNIPDNKCILLPTGDGICIALLNVEDPYDAHIQLALSILENIHEYNATPKLDKMRQFEVRIGISSNTDNLVTDINGKLNVAGAGINEAQRVMGKADGGQVLVSQAVHNTLRYREKYMNSFESFSTKIKHGDQLTLYQLKMKERPGLNTETPSEFKTAPKQILRLHRRLAYYMAHAIKNKQVIVDKGLSDDNAVVLLLYFLAKDSEQQEGATELDTVYPDTYKAGEAGFDEQYNYYAHIDRDVLYLLYVFIADELLYGHSAYFHESPYGWTDYRFVSEAGKRKLKADWPNIWSSFDLDAAPENAESG